MKCNYINRKKQIIVKAKFSSKDMINERELKVLKNNGIEGFLSPELVRGKKLVFKGSEGMPLSKYLNREISKNDFYIIILQIIWAIKKIENNNLFLCNLIFDLRYVYICENTKELQFIYIPQISNHIRVDVTGFMESIAYCVTIVEENHDFISEFISFIKSLKEENLCEIEEYILKQDSNVAKFVKNIELSKNMTEIEKQKNHSSYLNEKKESLILEEEKEKNTKKQVYNNEFEVKDLFEENEECMNTGQLYNEDKEPNIYLNFASLEKNSTNEYISINKSVFRMGKEKSCSDYFLENNKEISRNHADIITKNSKYYICDQNSANHTYLNGFMLPIKIETEIFDGDIIRLANEEFVFHVSKNR